MSAETATSITAASAQAALEHLAKEIGSIKSGMLVMDSNLLSDMNILLDKQMDTIDAINKIGLSKAPNLKVFALGVGLVFVGGVFVGAGLSQKSKKGLRNG